VGADPPDPPGPAVRGTLSDPNRVHVTLANLTDLADLATPGLAGRGETWGLGLVADDGRVAALDGTPVRAGWAQPAERWLLELMAVAAASVAFVSPSVSLLVVAVACVVGGTSAFVASGHPLGALPGRVVRRAGTLLRPRSSLWAPVIAARIVLGALVLSGGTAALVWLAQEGRRGVAVAARAGVWTDGGRVAAALVCATLLAGVGEGRQHRSAALRRWVAPATDGTLVILAVTCGAVAALVVTAVPHPTDPIASQADGLGWLPGAGLRGVVDGVRDDIVTNELNAVATCLENHTDAHWRPSYTTGNDLGSTDVARLVSSDAAPSDLATVALAAHNQLAPWVEVVEVRVRGSAGGTLRIDRDDLPHRQPLTDPSALVPAAGEGRRWLQGAEVDSSMVLGCSAGPVL
jgi:hypothetical protein